MRLKQIVTIGLVGVAAAFPWRVRGEALSDARHQKRQKAAEVLRIALRAPTASEARITSAFERYAPAVSEAIQLVGPESSAAVELNRALDQASTSVSSSETALKELRNRIVDICDSLDFAPSMEAEMPQGFPPPTPVGEVEVKQYPAYRMARTEADQSPAFWTLFKHIKQNRIAMTAPVEMGYDSTESTGPRQRSMAFLYGQRDIGGTGSDGSVQVVDSPPQTVVSIGVRGERNRQKLAAARQRLTEWIDMDPAGYRPAGEMRVMGYNSPFVRSSRRYFEVQIPVTNDTASGGEA